MMLPIEAESPLERRIIADPDWITGASWGEPRSGHPEGVVGEHIAEVLANVSVQATSSSERLDLRFLALVHDTFKYQVDRSRPRVSPNEHGALAARFAARYTDHPALLTIIELHDDAYRAWRTGAVEGDWQQATERASVLVDRLAGDVDLYLRFFRCDNRTGSKIRDSVRWFEGFLCGRGHVIPIDPFPIDPSLVE